MYSSHLQQSIVIAKTKLLLIVNSEILEFPNYISLRWILILIRLFLKNIKLIGKGALLGLDLVEFLELFIDQDIKVYLVIILQKSYYCVKLSLKVTFLNFILRFKKIEQLWILQ